MKKKKVVVMGGGNGGSISIRALKPYIKDIEISAIIAMSDSGYSSGRLREEFGVLPPGDILRAVLAMSRYDYPLLKRIFYDSRYSKHGKLKGFGLGHLFIAFVETYDGNIVNAIRPLAQAIDAVGPVFPVTLESSDLVAKLTNGQSIKGEHEIDEPAWDRSIRISRVWLDPLPSVYERARQELVDADAIIIGPGSFYTSIIATLLPDGVKEAIGKSSAKIYYVAGNAVEGAGETGPQRLSEFVHELETYLPRSLDAVLYNNTELTQKQKEKYKNKNWVEIVDDGESITSTTVLGFDYEKRDGGLDIQKLGEKLREIII